MPSGAVLVMSEATYYYAYDELGDDKLPTRCTGNKKCSVNENFEGWQAASSVMTCLDQAVPMRAADDPFEPDLWQSRPRFMSGYLRLEGIGPIRGVRPGACCDNSTIQQKDTKAKECMTILAAAVPDESEGKESEDELVKRLATLVYYDGDAGFCDCATDELSIPHCADFDDFRSVVREAHEACDALDQIDCAYLGAYADACRTAVVVAQFGVLDFSRERSSALMSIDKVVVDCRFRP